jgi:antitoxin (DNA-binding transcriptional repressor) of toxin-antitoxin stability system
MPIKPPTTITLSASETKRHLPKLVALIQEQGIRVTITRWGRPQVMLVPTNVAPGLALARHGPSTFGRPMVAVIPYARAIESQTPASLGGPGWLTIKAAAQQLGVARTTILYRIKRGELEARQLTEHRLKPWVVKLAPADQSKT